jgi:hypothetical protein
MNTMIETLEGRQMFSTTLAVDPAAPTPIPIPYPVVVDDAASAKVKQTPFVITKKIDVSTPVFFQH